MRRFALTLLALSFIAAGAAIGQDRGQDGGQDRGQERGQDRGDRQRGGRANFDPEQMRQRMMERLKERMGATDEEWQVIEPKLVKVIEAQREARGGMGGMMAAMGGRGMDRRGGRGGDAEPGPVVQATRALGETLQDETADAAKIKEQLAVLREARQKAEAELKAAQKDLAGVLTQRQEAMLVLAGMLE